MIPLWFTKRYEDSQLKVNASLHTKAREAEDARVLKRPGLYNQSWSATHLPYYGTSLCPKKEWGEGNE